MHEQYIMQPTESSTGSGNFSPKRQRIAEWSGNTWAAGSTVSGLCPSPIVPNLLLNEDEWTIQVYPGCHSWSFQSIPIYSNSVLLIRAGLAGEYESFEHVQKLCVASTNKFHSCLTHWQHVAIVFVAQLTCCILVILTVFLLSSGCSYCILGDSYM